MSQIAKITSRQWPVFSATKGWSWNLICMVHWWLIVAITFQSIFHLSCCSKHILNIVHDTYTQCCEPCLFCHINILIQNVIKVFWVFYLYIIIYDWITIMRCSKHELSTISMFYSLKKTVNGNLSTMATGRGGNSAYEMVGMLVVSLRGVNFGFWSHLGCSGQNTIIFSREGLVQGCTRKNIKIYIWFVYFFRLF